MFICNVWALFLRKHPKSISKHCLLQKETVRLTTDAPFRNTMTIKVTFSLSEHRRQKKKNINTTLSWLVNCSNSMLASVQYYMLWTNVQTGEAGVSRWGKSSFYLIKRQAYSQQHEGGKISYNTKGLKQADGQNRNKAGNKWQRIPSSSWR